MKPVETFVLTSCATFATQWVVMSGGDAPITLRAVSGVLAGALVAGLTAAWPTIRSRATRTP